MTMMNMLPLLMMANQSQGGSGSNGAESGSAMDMDMLMRVLMPDMFEEDVEPISEDASILGHQRGTDYVGMVQYRLLPPTLLNAQASLRVTIQGTLMVTDLTQLKRVGSWFQSLPDSQVEYEGETISLKEAFELAKLKADQMKTQSSLVKAAT